MHFAAAVLLIQSLSFNSSQALTPAQISWLNPHNLPTARTPTYPDCSLQPDDWRCRLVFPPDYEGNDPAFMIPSWIVSCRHAYCPWDLDLWENTYGSSEEETCGFWGNCESLPGWVEPTWELPGSAVPEPATLILLGTGLAGITAVHLRRRRRQW